MTEKLIPIVFTGSECEIIIIDDPTFYEEKVKEVTIEMSCLPLARRIVCRDDPDFGMHDIDSLPDWQLPERMKK